MSRCRLRIAGMLLALAIGAASAVPAAAQPPKKLPRIGIVFTSVAVTDPPGCEGCSPAPIVEAGLARLGWVNGKSIEILWRSAGGSSERMREIIAEFVRLPVDVINAGGIGAVEAARQTKSIPIVVSNITDPVGAGLVQSFARPGGNVTGLTGAISAQLDGKRLQLLKTVAPHVSRVAVLHWQGGDHLRSTYVHAEMLASARNLGLAIVDRPYSRPEDLPRLIDEAVAKGANALLVVHHTSLHSTVHQRSIHDAAIRHRLPVIHGFIGAASTGGLLAYGHDIDANYSRTPYYIDRILRGAKPGDLPFEQPSRVQLIVNLKAARAIGVTIPGEVLVQADRVIE